MIPPAATPGNPAIATAPGLEEQAYRRLRSALMEGAFSPGQKLSPRRAATALGTSSMPVRSALRRLATEGALETGPTGSSCSAFTGLRPRRRCRASSNRCGCAADPCSGKRAGCWSAAAAALAAEIRAATAFLAANLAFAGDGPAASALERMGAVTPAGR